MKEKKKKIKIGVSGDKGSFSEEAGIIYSNNSGLESTIIYLTDMDGVLKSVDSGVVDIGVFPVINSKGGLVYPAFDAMGKFQFKMVDEIWLDVKQCLLAKKSIDKLDIKSIVSHYQALAQCDNYLKNNFPKAKKIKWVDTAKAASDLANGLLDKNTAVIAPVRCAKMYNLQILDKNIQDSHPNLTTFIVVKKYEK